MGTGYWGFAFWATQGRQGLEVQRRRWQKAASRIEIETLRKQISNIEQGITNIEVRYSIINILIKD
jgi:hypothetical protein